MRKKLGVGIGGLGVLIALFLFGANAAQAAEAAGIRDPYAHLYKNYNPGFTELIRKHSGYKGALTMYRVDKKKMKLTSEPSFFTLCLIDESPRAYALVKAAKGKEEQGLFKEALEIYQKVIDDYPSMLYRVSDYGVFVPISQYCQLRILSFPKEHLDFYRTKYDSKVKEAYGIAQQRNSLAGLAEIRDNALATSYGAKALLTLGDSALDKGHYLEALEYFTMVRDSYRDKALHTPELALKIQYCLRMMDSKLDKPEKPAGGKSVLSGEQLAGFNRFVSAAKAAQPPYHSQLASEPNVGADDYTLYPPLSDPLALMDPVWKKRLPGSRTDLLVYSHPVVTERSVIYRHKNIVYCRSILNGELRWKNDTGGRAVWQNRNQRQYGHEDLVVQDGLVFTPMYKIGPSLVALDEITGQMKWAYGPIAASTKEEARMRFEAAPAGGPNTIYTGYIVDNIEGDMHSDSEYGVMAFESTTGRVRWKRVLCRLRPGKFTSGFAISRRNRIKSFISPPLYHQGTVYYCTNAGAIVALDALSGRVKWLMRYPYYPAIHDATRPFGGLPSHNGRLNPDGHHNPMFWFHPRPLLVGSRLFMMPVDTRMMFCMDRKTGKVNWTYPNAGGYRFLMGPTREGQLVLVENTSTSLMDPATGQIVWKAPKPIKHDDQPVMKHPAFWNGYRGILRVGQPSAPGKNFNRRGFYLAARPLLTWDDRLYVSHSVVTGPYGMYPSWCFNLAEISLKERKILAKRRYYTPQLISHTAQCIARCKAVLPGIEKWDARRKKSDAKWIRMAKEIAEDVPASNKYGPFLPCSRVTFDRYGVPFELRFGPRSVSILYDIGKVKQKLAARKDPQGLFAFSELALAEARVRESAMLMKESLGSLSSEDQDFRAVINQQLYTVYKRLARSSVQAGLKKEEVAYCVGMSRTVGTLQDEVETLFAISQAYERKGNRMNAGRQLRSIITAYGQYEFPIPSLLAGELNRLTQVSEAVLDRTSGQLEGALYGDEFGRPLALLKRGLPLYFSALSPLEKDLTVRAGDLAAARLIALQKKSPEFSEVFNKVARQVLEGKTNEEQLHRLWEFPATRIAQTVLDGLFTAARKEREAANDDLVVRAAVRRKMWGLADTARVCALTVPKRFHDKVYAVGKASRSVSVKFPLTDTTHDTKDERGTAWLVVERRGNRAQNPNMMFLAGRVKKKFDNKFVLWAKDLNSGKVIWKASEKRGERRFEEIRLKGKGNEPGFFEAFVQGDIVVVHGLYDVLAFALKDGTLKWRYRVPFDFEINHALMSGNLLVLSGSSETLALYMQTRDPRGEVAWQAEEEGNLYIPSYVDGERLVSVRKLPFGVTVRYRGTGKLIGRLALPDLSLATEHPLLDDGPTALPAVHDDGVLVVTDGWYYVAVDTRKMKVMWKRLIDNNDASREPPMRMALKGEYLAVVKQDFDIKTIYMLSSQTGNILWNTDPKNANSARPIHSMVIAGDRLYGIQPHAGQGFYFVCMDCKTGKWVFKPREEKGYGGVPEVQLSPSLYGKVAMVRIKDRQDFELKVFDTKKGSLMHRVQVKGAGNFGEHGRVSATVQDGKLALFGSNELKVCQ